MSNTCISLSGSVTVAQAAEIYQAAKDSIESGTAIEFELSDARAIDTSVIQLLLATRAAAKERDLSFRVNGASESLQSWLKQFGGSELLIPVEGKPTQGSTNQATKATATDQEETTATEQTETLETEQKETPETEQPETPEAIESCDPVSDNSVEAEPADAANPSAVTASESETSEESKSQPTDSSDQPND